MLASYRQGWLDDKASEELDYPIFFAVSQYGGKSSSGDPVFREDQEGNLMIDDHGHMIVRHDLHEVAQSFIAFAKEQQFDFWREG